MSEPQPNPIEVKTNARHDGGRRFGRQVTSREGTMHIKCLITNSLTTTLRSLETVHWYLTIIKHLPAALISDILLSQPQEEKIRCPPCATHA